MVINVRRSQCNSRRKKRARSSRKRLARFSLRCFEYMCTYVYMCVCIHGRVSGLGRNDGNPLGDWLVTSYQLREEREFSCDSDGLSIGIGSNVVVSRQALLKQWRLIESVASVQGAWTSPFFLDRASNLVAHVSRSEEDHRLFGWFWMDLEPTMSAFYCGHSYYYRSIHRAVIYRRMIFIPRFIGRQIRWYITHIVNDDIIRWLFEIYGSVAGI